MINNPLISIVVLNWNGKEDTIACLESLERQEYPNFEIIVVDNGSADDSVETIRRDFPDVELIETGKNLGFGGGNNRGIKRAMEKGTDYVFLLNNDTVVDPGMLGHLVAAGENDTTIGILGPKIYYYSDPRRIWSIGGDNLFRDFLLKFRRQGVMQLDRGQYDFDRGVAYLLSCALLIKREVVERVGLLDEDYFLCTDDFDFCHRAIEAGYKLLYVHRAKMWHKTGASTANKGYSAFIRYFIGRGSVIFMRKHGRWWQWPVFLGLFWGSIVYALFRESLNGNSRAVMSKIKGFYHGFIGTLAP
jgi:GT2 family glycosyltransferase